MTVASRILLPLALLALIGTLAGPAAADDGTAGLAVSAVRAEKRCLPDRVSASGTVVAAREVEVRADREGLVVGEVVVEPGDVVIKGQVLARLVPATAAPGEAVAVRAPADGTLLAIGAPVGAYVSSREGAPLFRIAEGGAVELKAQVLVAGLKQLRPGLPAKLHVVGLGDLDGRLVSIEDGVDPQTQLGMLHFSVNAEPDLRVGLFARADIDVGRQCGLVVPLSALLYGRDGALVGIVREDRVVMRPVTTGLLQGSSIAVRDGLSENDVVIARAGTFLREGDRVRPIETLADGKPDHASDHGLDDAPAGRP